MRKFLLFLILIVYSQIQVLKAQVGLEWAKSIGGNAYDYATDICTDVNGNVYVIGNFSSPSIVFESTILSNNNTDYEDIFIVKYDASGNVLWANSFGGLETEDSKGISTDANGNIYITGYFSSPSIDLGIITLTNTAPGYGSLFVVKYDTDGNALWANSADKSYGIDLSCDTSGNIYVTGGFSDSSITFGSTTLFNLGGTNMFVVKYDASGNVIWANSAGGSIQDWTWEITTDLGGNVYITGSFYSPTITFGLFTLTNVSSGNGDIFVVKYDALGNVIWANSAGGTDADGGRSVSADSNGNLYLAGYFYSPTITFGLTTLTNQGLGDIFITKYDALGNVIWANSVGGTGYDDYVSISNDANSYIYVTGHFSSPSIVFGTSTLNNVNYDDIFVAKYNSSGGVIWANSIGGIHNENANANSIDINGNIYVTGYFVDTVDFDLSTDVFNLYCDDSSPFSAFGDIFISKYKQKGIIGYIYQDINENCLKDVNELSLKNRKAIIYPFNIIVETNSSGIWSLDSLPAGNYTITVDTSGNWQSTCPITQNFTVINSDSMIIAPSFGFISTQPCAAPSVSVQMPFMRPCFTNQLIYTQACNTNLATGILTNGYVELQLDSLITPTSSSIPYTSLGNNTYSFDVGTLNPGQCVNFTVSTTLSCSATFGQTLCLQANLYPADSCVFDQNPTPPVGGVEPCTLPWDNSSLSVDGWCQSDTVYFSITNTGDFPNGNMQCYSPVRVFVDCVLTYLDSVLLTGGQTIIFSYFGNGQTWTLQADQHPLHPGNSHPNASVEACGDSTNWTPGLVNTLPLDDADPVVDIYCGVVTGSYDPNDKTGYPLGVGNDHFVAPNGKIDYVIRFQNTGTDTAFTVVVRDTLDVDLDIFSVQSGVSSHDYTFKMFGPRVLEWTFNYIMLPDSTSDLAGSNGFITFSVLQNPDLADGTVINNLASIYFDYNAPIFTNTTSHIINRGINYLLGVKEAKNINNNNLFIYPNPTKNQLNIVLSAFQNLKIEIYAVDGKLIERKSISKNTSIDVSNYKTGLYFINAINNKGEVYRNKFVKE